ncbi:Uncharacterised protein [Mycobacteroides abscessus]|nr:Uncharacterised protein [Mycobacteroides abscessus]
MSRSLPSMKPAAAAAQPEYELSIETTTGMSPPPIDATRCQPSASDTTVSSSSGHTDGATTNHATSPRLATSAPRLSRFRPGSWSGADRVRPDSLRNATTEPVNVTAPTSTPSETSTRCATSSCPAACAVR